MQMWLYLTKDNVNNSVNTSHSCNQPPWDELWGVPRVSLLCTLHDLQWFTTYVVLHTVEIHELFLELISTGSWLKLALVFTGHYQHVKAGANKDDAASIWHESMARYAGGGWGHPPDLLPGEQVGADGMWIERCECRAEWRKGTLWGHTPCKS